jgi:hypothetical protein
MINIDFRPSAFAGFAVTSQNVGTTTAAVVAIARPYDTVGRHHRRPLESDPKRPVAWTIRAHAPRLILKRPATIQPQHSPEKNRVVGL